MGIGLSELSKVNLKPSTLEEALVVTSQMAGIIVKLDKIIEDLIEKLNLNSNNSSKPPSTNFNKKVNTKVKENLVKSEALNLDTKGHIENYYHQNIVIAVVEFN